MENSQTILLDANIWIAYFNTQDSQHKKAEKIFAFIFDGLLIPIVFDLLIGEIFTVLTYYGGVSLGVKFLSFLIKYNVEIISTTDKLPMIENFIRRFSRPPKLSLADFFLVYFKRHSTLKIYTFDKQLQRVFRRVETE